MKRNTITGILLTALLTLPMSTPVWATQEKTKKQNTQNSAVTRTVTKIKHACTKAKNALLGMSKTTARILGVSVTAVAAYLVYAMNKANEFQLVVYSTTEAWFRAGLPSTHTLTQHRRAFVGPGGNLFPHYGCVEEVRAAEQWRVAVRREHGIRLRDNEAEDFAAEIAALNNGRGIGDRARINVIQGDITNADQMHFNRGLRNTIVSAANSNMNYNDAGGIAGAIGEVAGRDLLTQNLRYYPIRAGEDIYCNPGDARLSDSFGLARQGVDSIIHAVGPDCRNAAENDNREVLLRAVYRNIFAQAQARNTQVLYIPSISTNIFQYPAEQATPIAVQEVTNCVRNLPADSPLREVHFVAFNDHIRGLYQQAIDVNMVD